MRKAAAWQRAHRDATVESSCSTAQLFNCSRLIVSLKNHPGGNSGEAAGASSAVGASRAALSPDPLCGSFPTDGAQNAERHPHSGSLRDISATFFIAYYDHPARASVHPCPAIRITREIRAGRWRARCSARRQSAGASTRRCQSRRQLRSARCCGWWTPAAAAPAPAAGSATTGPQWSR